MSSLHASLAAATLCCTGLAAHAASCESLRTLQLPDTVIHAAESIPAGTYQPPGSTTAFADLPAFCRVTGTVSPVPGSAIGIEIWLPTQNWNHKYQQSGNHGLGGTFYWGEMTRQLQRGYATAVTDDGHTGTQPYDNAFAFGHPQRVEDFAWRAVHELAQKAKGVVAAYYGQPQRHAYFNGCSDGGREALKEAQRFPRDFDGIIAGSAVANYTRNATQQLVATIRLRDAGIVGAPGAALLALAQADAVAQCDALDGLADGQIRDPRACHWDPSRLVCKPGQAAGSCLTQAQADALAANEQALRDPRTGRWVMAPMTPGSEHDETRFGFTKALAGFALANYQIGLDDPAWDGSTFDLSTDLPTLDRNFGDAVNAIDPDLSAFRRAGGKLIEWHGWDDVVAQPGWTVDYYREVAERTGRDPQDFFRLFMLPGIGHCGTGVGPDNIGQENYTAVSPDAGHDIVTALEDWVERGNAPDQLIATRFNGGDPAQGIQEQRPICAFPAEAVYKGQGDPNAADSFVCAVPGRRGER